MHVFEQLKGMSEERFLAIYQALENNGFGPMDAQVATSLKFRPQAVRKLPMPQRARRARMLLERGKNAELAYEVFGSYLIKTNKEIVTRFLDQTGVEHEDGMIEDTESSKPDPSKVAGAIEALDKEFPPEDVTLYLCLCADQWSDIDEVVEAFAKRPGISVA